MLPYSPIEFEAQFGLHGSLSLSKGVPKHVVPFWVAYLVGRRLQLQLLPTWGSTARANDVSNGNAHWLVGFV